MVEIKELFPEDINEDFIDILYDAFKREKITIPLAKKRLNRRYNRNIHTFGIYEDGKLLGHASVIIELKMFNVDKSFVAHIEDVAIHKDYRGFGYGKQLVNYMVEFAKTKDCYKVVLYCDNSNLKFYKKVGFRHSCNLMRYDLE